MISYVKGRGLTIFLCIMGTVGCVRADTVQPAEKIWSHYHISGLIDSDGENFTVAKIDEQFKGRVVSIDDKMLSVTGLCHYEYTKNTRSPIKHWHSEKTVALYRQRLAENDIKLGDTVSLITPRNPSTDCPYPFSYFQQVGDNLIFVVNNRMIIYSHNIKVPDVSAGPICTSKEQTPDQVFEEGSKVECNYPKMNMAETYKAWWAARKEDKTQLPKTLPKKNMEITCKEVCISATYTWEDVGKLKIVRQFSGGETHTYFNQIPTGTQVITHSFPD